MKPFLPIVNTPTAAPLWLKRLILYASSFCVGPLILLIAILAQGRTVATAALSQPASVALSTAAPLEKAPAKATASDVTTGSENALAPEVGVTVGPAPEIVDGCLSYEKAEGERERVGLREIGTDVKIPSGCQVAFRSLRFSETAYLYIISCEPQEPSLWLLFPRAEIKFKNPLTPEPASGGAYDLPSSSLSDLPKGRSSVYETFYLITSSVPRVHIEARIREFENARIEDRAKAGILLRRLTEMLESPPSGVKVLKIQFLHVEPASERTRDALSTNTLKIE